MNDYAKLKMDNYAKWGKIKMDKYSQEIFEITEKVKKDFIKAFEKSLHGKGYYNWTKTDEDLISMTIREMWDRNYIKQTKNIENE